MAAAAADIEMKDAHMNNNNNISDTSYEHIILSVNNFKRKRTDIIENMKNSTDVSFHMMKVKRLNRVIHASFDSLAGETQKKKLLLDRKNLELQNVLYENEHLRKEIRRATKYCDNADQYDDISYDKNATLSGKALHDHRLQRLDNELQHRKALLKKRQELQQKIEMIEQNNGDRRRMLDDLVGQLDMFVKHTDPIREHFALTDSKLYNALPPDSTYSLLPTPLYFLYNHCISYGNAVHDDNNDDEFRISIEGDKDEASRLQQSSFSNQHDFAMLSTIPYNKSKNIPDYHPLSLVLHAKMDTLEVCLRFSYVPTVNLVTVKSSNDSSTLDSLLGDLYVDDDGNELGRDDDGKILYNENEVGKAYYWLQIMCGLKYLHPRRKEFAVPTVKQLLLKIRVQSSSVAALDHQLRALKDLELPPLSVYENERWLHVKPISCIKEFGKSNSKEFREAMHTNTADWPRHNPSYYMVVLNHNDEAELCIYIELSSAYPHVQPIFHLKFRKLPESAIAPNNHDNDNNDDNITLDNIVFDIEGHINTTLPLLTQGNDDKKIQEMNYVLVYMLRNAMTCLDVYMQCLKSCGVAPFPNENGKLFLRGIRGRDRNLAFIFDNDSELFVH